MRCYKHAVWSDPHNAQEVSPAGFRMRNSILETAEANLNQHSVKQSKLLAFLILSLAFGPLFVARLLYEGVIPLLLLAAAVSAATSLFFYWLLRPRKPEAALEESRGACSRL